MKDKINIRTIILFCIILFMGVWRLIQTMEFGFIPNFTPIGAMALFGGAYFSNRLKGYLLPILTLFVSDIILMHVIYSEFSNGFLYDGWIVNYFTFALMVLLGELVIKKVNFVSVFIASIGAGLIHYIVTDFALWLGGGIDITTGNPYTKDLNGFILCYTLALPFLKNMLIGNIMYCIVFFGGYEILSRKYFILKKSAV